MSTLWHHQQLALWVIAATLAIAVVVFLWRPPAKRNGESPEDIVKRRYASGEIDDETYEKLLTNLRK